MRERSERHFPWASTAVALLCLVWSGCGKSGPGAVGRSEDKTPGEVKPASQETPDNAANGHEEEASADKEFLISDYEGVVRIRVNASPPKGHPSDFFPTQPGTRWTYAIRKGQVDPIGFTMTVWPMGADGAGKSVGMSSRRLLYSRAARDSYGLQVTVKGLAKQQGPLRYPKGVELSIDRDDLGVFDGCKQAFWAISESGRYDVTLVLTFDPQSSRAPGGGGGGFGDWGRGDGHSMRNYFFADKPGIAISLSESPDSLLFAGVDRDLQGYEGREAFHFVRRVKPAEKEAGREWNHLDEGFREDEWFARDRGLVRLIQKIKGKTSMTMELASFKPGRE